MYMHFIVFLLAFGTTAMSAPTTEAAEGEVFLKSTPSHSNSTTQPFAPRNSLARRAPGIQLCKMNFRSDSTSGCDNKKGYILSTTSEKSTSLYSWAKWAVYKSEKTDLQCEHTIDLQLIRAALESKGFCKAWEGLLGAMDTQLTDKEKISFFKPLRDAANSYEGRYWCHTKVNQEKTKIVKKVAKSGAPTKGEFIKNSGLPNYFKGVDESAQKVAVEVEKAANDILDNLHKRGIEGLEDGDSRINPFDLAQAEYDKGTPVQTYWGYVTASN